VASELTGLASGPLPEIPTDASAPEAEGPPAEAEIAPPEPETPPIEPAVPAEAETPPVDTAPPVPPPVAPPPGTEPAAATEAGADGDGQAPTATRPRVSRRGGMVIIGLAVAIIIVVVVIIATSGGGAPQHHSTTTVASTPTTSTTAPASGSSTAPSSSTTTSSTTTAAKVVAQINLTPPSGASKAAGIAEVLREGTTDGIAIVAQNVPPNTTHPPNAYAVWLYNSPTDAKILGFVNPGVPKSGKLSTAGGLPANASHYKQLIVTVETSANPKKPGTIILQGTLTGV
jgi:outer membrane biosynthesis protein TonB